MWQLLLCNFECFQKFQPIQPSLYSFVLINLNWKPIFYYSIQTCAVPQTYMIFKFWSPNDKLRGCASIWDVWSMVEQVKLRNVSLGWFHKTNWTPSFSTENKFRNCVRETLHVPLCSNSRDLQPAAIKLRRATIKPRKLIYSLWLAQLD